MASLKITLTDAAGKSLTDHVTVDLFALHSSVQMQAGTDTTGSFQINGIDISSGPFYRVLITPANYGMTQQFVTLSEKKVANLSAAMPVNPSKVRGITGPVYAKLPTSAQGMLEQASAPPFNDGAGGFLQGEKLYAALDPWPLLKACFLNIVAKSAATPLQDGRRVLDHYLGLMRLEQDRLFVKTSAALLEEASHSNAFYPAPATLHEPAPGYHLVSSYKTFDRYGNLQLTFQRRGDSGSDYAVDVDIDDAQGIKHVFQVIRNSVAGPTNPYDIRELLVGQKPKVDPQYDFVLGTKLTIV